jgi:hypothetical protein
VDLLKEKFKINKNSKINKSYFLLVVETQMERRKLKAYKMFYWTSVVLALLNQTHNLLVYTSVHE